MRVLMKGLLAAAAVMLLAAHAHAQRGQGRGFGQFGAGNLMLLGQKSVQSELKLSEEQAKKIEALQEEQRASFAGLRDLDQEERRAKLAERMKAQDAAITSLLNADQNKRFKQIVWQQRGAVALGEPEVADALGLTQEQKDQLMTIQRAAAGELRGQFQGGDGDREAMRKKMQEARAATNEKALGVLTAEQREKWKALVGEPFKGEIVPPARRGRPGGALRSGNRPPTQAAASRSFIHLASFAPQAKDSDQPADNKPADSKSADNAGAKVDHARKRSHSGSHAAHRAHAARRAHLAHRRHVNGPPHWRPPVDRLSMRHHFRHHHLSQGWQGDHRYAGPGPRRSLDRYFAGHAGRLSGPERWRQHAWAQAPFRHHGPSMAWHHRPDSPRDAHWHEGGPPHHLPHHPHHHMASWHGGQHWHHPGPPQFRGPRGGEGDRPRDLGPDDRRPDGPRRPPNHSNLDSRDLQSQLTELERKLDELSRQLAAALEMTRR